MMGDDPHGCAMMIIWGVVLTSWCTLLIIALIYYAYLCILM
jgi:hypothetical protein